MPFIESETAVDRLPKITLDTTLADLYKIGKNGSRLPRMAVMFLGWSSGIDHGFRMPRNKKYQFQEAATVEMTEDDCHNFPPQKIRSLNAKVVGLISQRDTFVAGEMDAVCLAFDGQQSKTSQTEIETKATFAVLPPHQQPRPIFCSLPSDVPELMQEHHIDIITTKFLLDSVDDVPGFMNNETWYYLNSKKAIYDSGLPTPQTKVVEPEFCPVQQNNCCTTCASTTLATIPSTCTGPRLEWLTTQIDHMTHAILTHPLPLVVKSQQAAGGGGTWILTTASERELFISKARTIILPKLLSNWTTLNRTLHPANILLMEYISSPINNWGLTFFITRHGQPIFLSGSSQKLHQGKLWYGSSIDYSEQSKLASKFESIMTRITDFVHHQQLPGHKYFGPIGADILEVSPTTTTTTTSPSQDPDASYKIVDLNVRLPGSLPLALLKSHYMSLNLPHALNLTLQLPGLSRAAFIKAFETEFHVEKSIVILAWYFEHAEAGSLARDEGGEKEEKEEAEGDGKANGTSHAVVVIGAGTPEALDTLVQRVQGMGEDFRVG